MLTAAAEDVEKEIAELEAAGQPTTSRFRILVYVRV
jgi:hypothetical protein